MRRGMIFAWMPAMLLVAGCMTPSTTGDLHRMEKYRPAAVPIVLPEPVVLQVAAETADTGTPGETVKTEGTTETAATPETTATQGTAATPETAATVPPPGVAVSQTDGAQTPPPATPSDAPGAELPAQPVAGAESTATASDTTGKAQGQRNLSRGDRIMISLRGIPRGEEIKNIIDGLGEVTLPYIGQVRVAGLTPSDAERLIETTYVDRGIYRNINVIVVAEDKVYFVQGEVARQGKFSMSGDVTLLQAITEAGGYSPFANRRNVKIIRGDQVLFYNARDIANGRTPDPVIASDDIIVVLRSLF